MAKIFFDANIFIGLTEKRTEMTLDQFSGNSLFISPLSIHILCYAYKYQMPSEKLGNMEGLFKVISFNQSIALNALKGPTKDFEDNVQLHTAAQADCDVFLTEDKQLLKMKFFGKMKILENLETT